MKEAELRDRARQLSEMFRELSLSMGQPGAKPGSLGPPVLAAAFGSGLVLLTVHDKDMEAAYINGLPSHVDRNLGRLEVRYLTIFMIDFCVFRDYGETPVKNSILDAFYASIEAATRGLSMKEIDSHHFTYMTAMKYELAS